MIQADNKRQRDWRERFPRLSAVPGVFIGGVLGSSVRAALSMMQPTTWAWPWITFCINMVGSLLLGFLLEYLARTGEDRGRRRSFRLFAGTGIIGGFTTYGTFILEADTRLMQFHVWVAVAYLGLSILLGIAFAGVGVGLAQRTAHLTHGKSGEQQ